MAIDQQTRVGILTADAGFGHRRAAEAIRAALEKLHGDACAVELLNPLDDRRAPRWLRGGQAAHDQFARGWRRPYGWAWGLSCARLPKAGLAGVFRLALSGVMADLIDRRRPDVLITTYPLYHPALDAVLARGPRRPPLLTIVTDLGAVHPLWFSRAAHACLVATDVVRCQALACGLSPARVHLTGVPVDPRLGREPRDPAALRAELGWRPGLTTVLAVGSRRVLRFAETLQAVDQLALPLQWAIVAGGDDDLFAQLKQSAWRAPAHLYNWVDDLPRLMRAADCLLSKAGGLIMAEALACGLPVLLVDHLPDQERGNLAWLAGSGAGEAALDPGLAAETLRRWLAKGGRELAQRARAARAVGRPRAAYDVAEHAWQAVQRSP